MDKKERENFYRNTILIVDFTKCAFVELLELHLTGKHLSFEEFLNQNQHDLYHLCYNKARCCQCIRGNTLLQNRVLSPEQLEVLFEKSGTKLPCHNHGRNAEFCCSKAKFEISTNILDVTLARCLLINFCADVFWYSCLTFSGITLEDFLNMNKHDIYHLTIGQNSFCCQCPPGYVIPLNPQFTLNHLTSLFSATQSKCVSCSSHTTCVSRICELTAIKRISTGDLDQYVADVLLQKNCAVRKAIDILIGKRNTTYGHASETKISDEDYNKCRSETEPALLLLAAVCQKEEETKQKLHDLQQRPLDENAKAVLDSMQTKIDSLGQSQTVNTQMILKEIKGSRKGYYRDWNFLILAALKVHTEAGTFVETCAVSAAMTFLKKFGIVVITGPPGSGKSRIAMELLHQFSNQEKSYQVLQLPDISEWQDVIELNEDCIVLCDDILGRINCDLDENIHSKLIDMIITYVTNGHVKVIMTLRERVKRIRNCLFTRRRSLLCECIIDLSSESFQMNDEEKRECLVNYFHRYGIEETCDTHQENYSEISQHFSGTVFFHTSTVRAIIQAERCLALDFPQTCVLFTSNRKFLKQGELFFKHANEMLCQDILDIKRKGETDIDSLIDFTTLTFIAINGCSIDKGDINIQDINEVSSSIFSQRKIITRYNVIESVERLNGTFLRETSNKIYTFQHRAILESVLMSCHYIIKETNLIKAMDFDFIIEMTRPDDFIEEDGRVIFKISSENYSYLAKELLNRLTDMYLGDPYLFTKLVCESPIVLYTGKQIIKHLCVLFRKKRLFEYFRNKSFYLVQFSSREIKNAFDLTVAILIYCNNDCKVLEYLQGAIMKNLSSKSVENCKTTLIIAFFTLCKTLDYQKLFLILEIFKLNSIELNGRQEVIDGCVAISKEVSSLEFFCDIVADDNLFDVNCFVTCLLIDDFSLEKLHVLLSKFDRHSFSIPLWIGTVCMSKRSEYVRELLLWFDVNFSDVQSALSEACVNENLELVYFFITKTPEYNILDMEAILHETCEFSSLEFLVQLLQKLDTHTLLNITPMLIWACKSDNIELIHVLIENMNHNMFDLNTVMEWACENRNDELVIYLLEKIEHNFSI
ncbi:unnamed protein product [Mytilus edulis]|uniref:Novel STAND NTPase 3 domain-containing protein n=1 Tax=Mytilus edulis TaxID=6550 RepID=A0A8S3RQ31_MYTED|nr:unnamed protein product [Mytilus edulis]